MNLRCRLLALFTGILTAILNRGLPPINAIPWDNLLLLDGGWRILNQQVPHTNYYNPIGPLTYLLTAIGMKVASPSASSIVYGNALCITVLTLWAWWIARSRLPAGLAFLFVLSIGFLLIAPRALGFDFQDTTYAMIYNRQGFALFSLLLVSLFIPPRPTEQLNSTLAGTSSGVLLALLLFCKITYFGFGAIAILIYFFLNRKTSTSWYGGLAIGFSGVCLGMHLCFRINLGDYFSDIVLASQAQSRSGRLQALKQSFWLNINNIFLTLLPLLVVAFQQFVSKTQSNSLAKKFKVWLITIFIITSGLIICSGNSQNGKEIPLFLTASLIIFAFFHRELRDSSQSSISHATWGLLVCVLILPLVYGGILIRDIGSVGYALNVKSIQARSVGESQHFQSASLHDFTIPAATEAVTVYWKANELPDKVNDGLALLRRHISVNSRIFSMTYANPFPFALGLPSPIGAPLWWDVNYSFSRKSFPEPEVVFQEANVVIVPKLSDRDPGCCIETVALMQELYGDFLKRNFSKIDASQFWTLWVRRSQPT